MKITRVRGLICSLILVLFAGDAWSANILNSDSEYSVKIAVTINEDDHIMGKLEYSNHEPQYTLQLVTFNPIGGVIHAEPYLFELVEKTIVSKNVHRIRCRPVNDKYGSTEITGVIDFSVEFKPRVKLVNAAGYNYIGNLTTKGKRMHQKYIPNVWLGN